MKATTRKFGHNDFYISANELEVSKQKDNYFIYHVFEVDSLNPKIWVIKPKEFWKNDKIVISPILYKIEYHSTIDE